MLVLLSQRIPAADNTNQGEIFFRYLLHNDTVDNWNSATSSSITSPTVVCGRTSHTPFEGNLSDFYSGPLSDGSGIILNDANATDILENTTTYDQLLSEAPFDQGCAVIYAASPSVWDRKNRILWGSPGKISIYYNSQCRRRHLREWSNYCPASPCGTGTHTEHGQPIRETITATINGRPCSTNSSTHPRQGGMAAQSIQTAGVITCDIQPNETAADISVEHYCTSIILITHKTLKCGWKLVCGPKGPSKKCEVPMKSPPVQCGNPPTQGVCSVGGVQDAGGAPGGAGFAFPCGCHRVPDPGNSCWNCATTTGSSGGIHSHDTYRLHLDLSSNITVSGYYDVGDNAVSGYIEAASAPDVISGFLIDDVFYSTVYLAPRHVLFRKSPGNTTNESAVKEYTFENFYNVTDAQNDSDYYDFVFLDAFPLKLSGAKGSRITVNNMDVENNTHRFMFTYKGDIENLTLGVVTLGDILSAETQNISCSSKAECTDPEYTHCINGFCVSLNLSENHTFHIANNTRRRNETRLATEVLSPLKPDSDTTVRVTLTDQDMRGLGGRNVSVRVTNYGISKDYVTDGDGSFDVNFTASNKNAVLMVKFPGDGSHRGESLTQTLSIAGITPGLLNIQLILGLMALLFFVVYAFRWHEGMPSFYDIIEDAKRVLG